MSDAPQPPIDDLPLDYVLRWLNGLAAAAGAISTLGFMLYAGQIDSLIWWLIAPVFMAWACAPYAGFAVRTRRARARSTLGLLLIACLATLVFGVMVYYDATVIEPDPQAGLVFLFMPLWQTVGLALVWMVARVLDGPEPVDDDPDSADLEA